MLAVNEATKLIKSAEYDELQEVYSFKMPENQLDNVNDTLAVITDVNTRPGSFGSNDFFDISQEIEVQIYYKANLNFEPSQLEMKLMKLFTHNDWHVSDVQDHTVDPDTNQLTATFYFVRRSEIENTEE